MTIKFKCGSEIFVQCTYAATFISYV